MNRLFLTLMSVALVLAGMAPSAVAQTTRTLAIHDGRVVIDGQDISAEELPATLQTQGLNVDFSFTGNTSAVLELGGRYYVLDENGLREIDDADAKGNDVAVFFKDGAFSPDINLSTLRTMRGGSNGVSFVTPGDEPFDVMRQHYQAELQDRARSLQELSAEMERQGAQHAYDQMVQQARQQTAEAARVADALPRIEAQSYLQDVQRTDRALFDQLVNEQRMERDTRILASQIRNAKDDADREKKLDELRTRLNDIFDLKQSNRDSEIKQLETRLDALKLQVDQREHIRDQIIELRLKQLLDQARNW